MRVIIDRFEAEYAVVELEDGSMALMATKLLPGARRGCGSDHRGPGGDGAAKKADPGVT